MQPLVSILIPLYNAEAWISETIQSAIAQTWRNKEIIIIDDGSTDNSLEIAQSFSSPILKIISQKYRGGSAARNKAFNQSQGEYIQYLDADDIIAPEKIEVQMYRLINEPTNTVASGAFYRFRNDITKVNYSSDSGWTDFEDPIDWMLHVAHGKAMFPPVVWLTPRNIIDRAGSWNENITYNDDMEFFTRVLINSKKIAFCPRSWSYYRHGNPLSVGHRKDSTALTSRLRSLQLISKAILSHEDSLRTRNACGILFQKFIFSTYPKEKNLIKDAETEIRGLGVSVQKDFGKGNFKFFSRFFGWKASKWIRHIYYKFK